MDDKVTVVIPVGPNPVYLEWLPEAVESVFKQTYPVSELLIIDDMSELGNEVDTYPFNTVMFELFQKLSSAPFNFYNQNLQGKDYYEYIDPLQDILITYWRCPWLSGVSHAFNYGMALADHELVFQIGSDDKLMPTCIEECVKEYHARNKAPAYYNVTDILDTGEMVSIPNHSALYTKQLWKDTGGFPVQAALGAPDALFLSILMVHFPDRIFQVKEGTPLYWVRTHEHQMTKHDMAFYATSGCIEAIRNKEAERWVKPTWTK